jgi:hypothetical protein
MERRRLSDVRPIFVVVATSAWPVTGNPFLSDKGWTDFCVNPIILASGYNKRMIWHKAKQ